MSHVFISYSQRDTKIASRVRDQLIQAGVPVWLDSTDLKAGAAWKEAIEEALHKATSVLLLLSPAALNSPHIAQEYSYVLSRNKHLYIAVIDPISPQDIPYRLSTMQYVDLTTDFDSGIEALIRAIQAGNELSGSIWANRASDDVAKSKATVQLRVDLKDYDESKLVSLVTKLVEAGVQDIQVVDVAEE